MDEGSDVRLQCRDLLAPFESLGDDPLMECLSSTPPLANDARRAVGQVLTARHFDRLVRRLGRKFKCRNNGGCCDSAASHALHTALSSPEKYTPASFTRFAGWLYTVGKHKHIDGDRANRSPNTEQVLPTYHALRGLRKAVVFATFFSCVDGVLKRAIESGEKLVVTPAVAAELRRLLSNRTNADVVCARLKSQSQADAAYKALTADRCRRIVRDYLSDVGYVPRIQVIPTRDAPQLVVPEEDYGHVLEAIHFIFKKLDEAHQSLNFTSFFAPHPESTYTPDDPLMIELHTYFFGYSDPHSASWALTRYCLSNFFVDPLTMQMVRQLKPGILLGDSTCSIARRDFRFRVWFEWFGDEAFAKVVRDAYQALPIKSQAVVFRALGWTSRRSRAAVTRFLAGTSDGDSPTYEFIARSFLGQRANMKEIARTLAIDSDECRHIVRNFIDSVFPLFHDPE